MSTIILTILMILSVGLHLKAQYFGPEFQVYIFNPLTMIFIIGLAAMAPKGDAPKYKRTILAGLSFSLVGDILLMLPLDLFIPGLVSFLIAQMIYIYAFSLGRKLQLRILPLIPFAIYGLAVFFYLAPGLGALMIPVIAYIIVIMVMAWQAWEQWNQSRGHWALLAFTGAIFFVLSDTFLAINKFGQPFEAATALTLIPYALAQWLIALSIRREGI
jgi:uncharacterized membrane protein YhhN